MVRASRERHQGVCLWGKWFVMRAWLVTGPQRGRQPGSPLLESPLPGEARPSVLLGLQLIRGGPPMLGRAVCFLKAH